MKKILIGLSVIIVILGLVGCENEDEPDIEIHVDDLFTGGFVGGVFRDEIADFEFHLPHGWVYFPEYALIDISMDMRARSGDSIFYTLIANDQENNIGLVVIYEEMVDLGQQDWNANNELLMITDAYSNRFDVREIGEVFMQVIAGHEYEAVRIYFYDFQGLEDGTLTFFARRIGNFMLSMSISGPADNDVLDYFR